MCIWVVADIKEFEVREDSLMDFGVGLAEGS